MDFVGVALGTGVLLTSSVAVFAGAPQVAEYMGIVRLNKGILMFVCHFLTDKHF